jgi:ribosomal protein S12 methylthiotransferase
MSAPRIHLVSLGCAKNLVDSERILGRLAAAGAVVGAEADEAEIILVNTCGFIDAAKEESIETVLGLIDYKRAGPCEKLIVMGCLAQRYAAELRESMPEVDGVFGLGEEEAIIKACGLSGGGDEADRLLLTAPHTAYLRISDGCDNQCAYCAIPLIRGAFRSRPYGEILAEAEQLVAAGAREINVIGQDTSSYGVDLYGEKRIHELLRDLAKIRKLKWLRLLYTHPAHFTDDLIQAYADIPKLCPYVDLPIQHLSDPILKRMGRKVTQTQVVDLIARMRAMIPNVAIRTTFIVGFPGETRAQFNEMLALVRELKFDHMGAFAYSREEGTRAARMKDRVSELTAKRRLHDLMAAQQAIAFEHNAAMIGQEMEVLVEGQAKGMDGSWISRSRRQAPDVDSTTIIRGAKLKPGQFVTVRITDAEGYDLIAEM